MIKFLKHLLHPRKLLDDAVQAEVAKASGQPREERAGRIVRDADPINVSGDPLTTRGRQLTTGFGENQMFATADQFPTESSFRSGANGLQYVGDSALVVADSNVTGSGGVGAGRGTWAAYGVPESLMSWYSSHSFIGYQSCAIMAQHWLIDKCCAMPGEDAVRNGYTVSVASDAMDTELDPDKVTKVVAKLQDLDNDFNITDELIQFWRFTQIYGIRVAVFDVESDDPKYYEKPFNIDGVKPNSYKGIRQVDPYWMTPVLVGRETSDPTNPHFYDPSFWVIAGKKYHRSHLIIGRGPEPADILKPSYQFGGIPLVQRIYERVYAAERTANEGPLLAMTKRTTVLKTNLATAEANPIRFRNRILAWTELRDNFGVKTVNTDDVVEQHDTGLADLDVTIMTQYQIVAGMAKVPATKLLGTSPKGFGATGEHETKSYHEHLESVQKFLTPLLTRHHELLARSVLGDEIPSDLPVKHTWNRVDTFTALELADLNLKKAQTDEILVTTVAAISSDESRTRLKNDNLSGFGHLSDMEAETEIGITPEVKQGEIEAQAKETTALAKEGEAAAAETNAGVSMESGAGPLESMRELASIIKGLHGEYDPRTVVSELEMIVQGLSQGGGDQAVLAEAIGIMEELVAAQNAKAHTVKGSVKGVSNDTLVKAQGVRASDGNQTGLPDNGGANHSHRSFRQHKYRRLTVSIENPAGSIRSGVAKDGTHWRSQMPFDYGFINGTKGADGDEVDAFIGPAPGGKLFVINQIEPTTRKFDEHKVMIGFNSEHDALAAYRNAYQPGWKGLASCWEVTPGELTEWLREDDLSRPYRELYAD